MANDGTRSVKTNWKANRRCTWCRKTATHTNFLGQVAFCDACATEANRRGHEVEPMDKVLARRAAAVAKIQRVK